MSQRSLCEDRQSRHTHRCAGDVGIVTAMHSFTVKVLWRGCLSRWHDDEELERLNKFTHHNQRENHHERVKKKSLMHTTVERRLETLTDDLTTRPLAAWASM